MIAYQSERYIILTEYSCVVIKVLLYSGITMLLYRNIFFEKCVQELKSL